MVSPSNIYFHEYKKKIKKIRILTMTKFIRNTGAYKPWICYRLAFLSNLKNKCELWDSHLKKRFLAELYRHQEERSSKLFSHTGQDTTSYFACLILCLNSDIKRTRSFWLRCLERKLILSLWHKKPNLENITIEKYSIPTNFMRC